MREGVQAAIDAAGLGDAAQVVPTGCQGLCSSGQLLRVEAEGQPTTVYSHATPAAAPAIVARHTGGEARDLPPELPRDLPFFARQRKIVLSNVGVTDPERYEDYVAEGGYAAFATALTRMTPAEVCEEVTRSGLRGRGGAGFPARSSGGTSAPPCGDRKFVVANGDEGDPGAYMDRTIMEDDPHRIIEGMAIAAHAVGAREGHLYVRGEYPVAVKRLERAIRRANRAGLLGDDIFGTSFDFTSTSASARGPSSAARRRRCWRSIEGRRGTRASAPYPAQHGLWGHPTLLNNVETYANIAPIIANEGADWFAGIGAPSKDQGLRLAGKLRRTGLIEVLADEHHLPRHRLPRIGGGIADRAFKAAQTGGPSGGCISATHLDTPVDYDNLRALGSIMRPGGAIVMDDRLHARRRALLHGVLRRRERYGKCAYRIGTRLASCACWNGSAGRGEHGRPAQAGGSLRHGRDDEPLRPGAVGPQPVRKHAAPLPRRIRGPHPGAPLPGRRLHARRAPQQRTQRAGAYDRGPAARGAR
ncbi:MAG: NADH-quinone oxidoreductase subunit L [Thermomicrobiales bacterium]